MKKYSLRNFIVISFLTLFLFSCWNKDLVEVKSDNKKDNNLIEVNKKVEVNSDGKKIISNNTICNVDKNCWIDNELKKFLVSKWVKELIFKDGRLEARRDEDKKFNQLLIFKNLWVNEWEIWIDWDFYKFDKDYNITSTNKKVENLDEILNYQNFYKLVLICSEDMSFVSLDKCILNRNVFLNPTNTWNDFLKNNDVEKTILSIKWNSDKINTKIEEINNKIKTFQEQIDKNNSLNKSTWKIFDKFK